MVTPDGQRTMRTCLGAAQQLRVEDLPVPAIQASDLLHCEGYCLYKADVLKAAVSIAKASHRLVSLDLASFEVVRNCKSTLTALLESRQIDIVICNEDEAAEMVSVLGVGTLPPSPPFLQICIPLDSSTTLSHRCTF
jgi:sugar/nucleoside kinase (ribokinase family)